MEAIKVGIFEILSKWKDLVLFKDAYELLTIIQGIEALRSDFNRHFAILYNFYNGPQKDIIMLQENLFKWFVIKEEALRLLREGRPSRL